MAPCGWEVTRCGCGTGCWDSYTPAVRERAAAAAALILWAATGRRFGPCPMTLQPSGRRCTEPLYQAYPLGPFSGLLAPVIEGGQWYNRPYSTDGLCCATTGCEVELPGPTTKTLVTAVTLDGVVLDRGSWWVMDGNMLVRSDGVCWPCCVNYTKQDPPNFTVELSIGLPIPAGLQLAFERLACEYSKACGGADCALPQRMTRLSRQGVDIELEQVDVEDLNTGRLRTGLKDVDDVILALNPWGLAQGPMVLSPDLPPARRLTP